MLMAVRWANSVSEPDVDTFGATKLPSRCSALSRTSFFLQLTYNGKSAQTSNCDRKAGTVTIPYTRHALARRKYFAGSPCALKLTRCGGPFCEGLCKVRAVHLQQDFYLSCSTDS